MRSSILLPLAALAALAPLSIACGGASTSDLFDPPSNGAPADASTTPSGPTAGNGPDAAPPDHGHPIGPGSEDSGTPIDPHPDAGVVDTGAPQHDSGIDAGPTDPGVYCGVDITGAEHYCEAKTSACCATSFNNGGPPSYACSLPVSLPCAGTRIECDDGADCPGQICCGKLVNNRYQTVTCQTKCDSTSATQAVRFCNPDAPVDECAPLGLQCNESTALPGFYRCS